MEQGTRESAGEPVADGGGGGAGGTGGEASRKMIRWDQIFPRRSLRVLLVEHDDSTRQIVTALLRKCSYHVVSVADGLKAWEIMQEKRFVFDLVLSEVEMPLLSGIGLLSKIVSTEECKNIPVIMMSSQDSIGVVLKCMLKGASDFLVKPVRKNELRTLWQHVWRRQFASQANGSKTGENSDGPNGEQSSESQEETEIQSTNNLTEIQSKNYENTPTINENNSIKEDGINMGIKENSAPLFHKEEISRGKSIVSSKSENIESKLKMKDVLNHSQGSAFARYGEKKIQNSSLNPSSSSFQNTESQNLNQIPNLSFIPVQYGYTTILHPIYYPSNYPNNNNNDNNNNNNYNNGNDNNMEMEDSREIIKQDLNINIQNNQNIDYIESGNESTAKTGDRSRREAALMKFRLKRKDRCFEKKVRYYNRKKLAEQRPRIKGQFVSQKTNQSNNQNES